MATRLYFGTAAAAPISPAVDAGWARSIAGFARWQTGIFHDGSALADVSELFGSTATSDTCWQQWVTDALDRDLTISGTITAVIRVQELSGTEDACLAFVLRVVSNDGTVVRGTLISHLDASILEFNSGSPTTRIVAEEALTAVNAMKGDRLVLEMGIHGVTPDNLVNCILRFGAPVGPASSVDFDRVQGLSTDLTPWWELSQDIFVFPVIALPQNQRMV